MKIEIEKSSGNVYADLGIEDPFGMKIKAALARAISDTIKSRALTQVEAAKCMRVSQPKVSAILRGVFRGVSVEKMMECLQRLGMEVHISIHPSRKSPSKRRSNQLKSQLNYP